MPRSLFFITSELSEVTPISLRQLQALYWTAELGSFGAAAQKLNLAQSTISKRIIELETAVGAALFDRSTSEVRLTRAGEASLGIASEMLALEVRFHEAAGGAATFAGLFRFGTTELVALTWLPQLVVAMKAKFPRLVPVPEVAASIDLFGKLVANELDLVIGLDPPQRAGLTAVPLETVQLEWVAAPGFGPASDTIPLTEMARYPILSQTHGSGLQRLVLDWAVANGLQVNRVVQCNSLNVLAGLAAAGLGVTFLTADYFGPEIAAGHLRVIKTDPRIPPIRYHAVYRSNDISPLAAHVARLAKRTCDFSARGLRPA